MDNKKTHLRIPASNISEEIFVPPGGGKSFFRNNYTSHGQAIIEKTKNFSIQNSTKNDASFSDKLFLEIETPIDFPIKNGKEKIKKLGFDIVKYSKTSVNAATASITKDDFEVFKTKSLKYASEPDNPGKSYFSIIENIGEVPPAEKLEISMEEDENEILPVIISLYNDLRQIEVNAIIESIHSFIKEKTNSEGTFNTHKYLSGITVIVSELTRKILLELTQNYSTVNTIRPNKNAVIEQSIPQESLPNPIVIDSINTDTIVAIVDTGIADSNLFNNVLIERIPLLPFGAIRPLNDHGTFVASRCVYGDNIDNCLTTHRLKPLCKIIDVPVFGSDNLNNKLAPSEDRLILALDTLVTKINPNVRVINLSLGFNYACTNNCYSLLAKEIDFLSKEYNLLFVISSGNVQKLGDYPVAHFESDDSRISSPAESLLSITVGAIAKFTSQNSLAKIDELSPFSRRGPGIDNGIKPELVAHGGNLTDSFLPTPRISTYGLFEDSTRLATDVGTSFSAPLISQMAAMIFNEYPNATPNLVKALLIHFSESRQSPPGISIEQIYMTGFGEPILDNALFSKKSSVAYIFQGKLKKNIVQSVKFHIPPILASDKRDSKLKLRITLVYDPAVNLQNNLEYSKCRITMNIIKNYNGVQKSVNGIESESKYLQPWNPIIHFEKRFVRNYSVGEWFIKLRLITRGDLPDDYVQYYSIVVEVIDEKNSVDVFNDILNEYGELYSPISLQGIA